MVPLLGSAPDGFDRLLVRSATWVLLLAAGWLAVVLAAVLVEALTSGRLQPARFTGVPLSWRRSLLAGTLAGLAAIGVAPGAHADYDDTGAGDTTRAALQSTRHDAVSSARQTRLTGRPWTARTALEGLPLPGRTEGAPVSGIHPDAPDSEVIVHVGDSLWQIARRLSPGATDAQLLTATRALHHANRSVIGPDPDRLVPGQQLVIPSQLDRHGAGQSSASEETA